MRREQAGRPPWWGDVAALEGSGRKPRADRPRPSGSAMGQADRAKTTRRSYLALKERGNIAPFSSSFNHSKQCVH